ncbi:MAG: hypothetical protein ACE5KE_12230 [Methanosarcinales archaeon]
MNFEVHYNKYIEFKESAKQDRYIPSRIEDYFKAAFHLIESIAFKRAGLHIQKHQKIRKILSENPEIFEEETEKVINNFHEIENKIRVTTGYGKRDDGELLEKTIQLFEEIERIGLSLI